MSKADQFASSSAFSRASGARSARAQMYAEATGKILPDADGTLPLDAISQNPDNPRDHLRNLDEMTQTIREVGVINPITVATVEAYLADRPDREHDLDPDTQYLVVDGHRRLEASRRAGEARIKVMVDNARVATDESLLEAAFVANYHRDNMSELEEAHALEALVKFYGGQTKAAQRLGIAQATISSKLSLLKLHPVLQADLAEGRRNVKHVRNLGKLSPEEQVAQADARAAADEAEKQRRLAARQTMQPTPGPGEGDRSIRPAGVPAAAEPVAEPAGQPRSDVGERGQRVPAAVFTAPQPETKTAASAVPEQRPELEQAARPTKMPWDNPVECARIIGDRMKPAERQQLVVQLLEQERIDIRLGYVEPRPS
ncbi:ParB/RepB/Spo0J family partition protein [Streptomyces sp. NPDC054847]